MPVEHEGKKYLRRIVGYIHRGQPDQVAKTVEVDVYDVLEAFGVICPAVAHAVKKLLCAGQRGKGSVLDDLVGAEAAVLRAIELQEQRAS